jgi:hypothetical protein
MQNNKNFKNRKGEVHVTNEGFNVRIIEYFNWNNCTIEFIEDKGIIKNVQYGLVKRGAIKNPLFKTLHGVGFYGYGNYKSWNNVLKKNTKAYVAWSSMMFRCYVKEVNSKRANYLECYVCEEWHNFQNFAKWHEENYDSDKMDGWHLDKDILVKGNKVYGPETCCFVPAEINTLFINRKNDRGDFPVGVKKCRNGFTSFISKHNKRIYLGYFNDFKIAFNSYKTAKECYIKEVADLFKNSISEKVYNAMYEYKIEITD